MINTIVVGGQYDDPTEDGNNLKCKICSNDAINLDEYCEKHQRCYFCGDNDDCNCEEEMKLVSDCCGAKIDTDRNLCYDCKDNSQSAWDAYIENK